MTPADNPLRDQSAERFLRLVQERRRGRLRVYIGLAAGGGKTSRMLLEARDLRAHAVDVVLGYGETHGRPGTVVQPRKLPQVPRKTLFYKGRAYAQGPPAGPPPPAHCRSSAWGGANTGAADGIRTQGNGYLLAEHRPGSASRIKRMRETSSQAQGRRTPPRAAIP
ncbi:hypothetical protein GCM10022408_37150 [Hymenobacter fastidiosus]|uniref:Signal transduction histidine kinase osmosensitive K+ channel sensor N-terminal domain-containing protein n=1 Tax=Hymenobacter fastidiosus TaxID=486264 RepID=A0ABP7T1D7_9BACT